MIADGIFETKRYIDALREIANRAGAPTMYYSPEYERQEQRESLDWIAQKAREALLEDK